MRGWVLMQRINGDAMTRSEWSARGCGICGNERNADVRAFHLHIAVEDDRKFGGLWDARLWRTDDDGNGEVVAAIRNLTTEGAAQAAGAALLAAYEAARINATPAWPNEADDDGRGGYRVHVIRRVESVLV
jgi:hypothetical protein